MNCSADIAIFSTRMSSITGTVQGLSHKAFVISSERHEFTDKKEQCVCYKKA